MNLKKPVLLHKICAHLIKGSSRHDLDVTLHFSAKRPVHCINSLVFFLYSSATYTILIVAVGIYISNIYVKYYC